MRPFSCTEWPNGEYRAGNDEWYEKGTINRSYDNAIIVNGGE